MGEHIITVRSVQIYKGQIDESFVNEDGTLNHLAHEVEFVKEKSLSYECSCGKRFLKGSTVAEHLLEQKEDEE